MGYQILEQFIKRAKDLKYEGLPQPIYVIANFEQLALLKQIQVMKLVNRLFEKLEDGEFLNLCIVFTAETEREAHVLVELKQAKAS